jgi:hypothetical protein
MEAMNMVTLSDRYRLFFDNWFGSTGQYGPWGYHVAECYTDSFDLINWSAPHIVLPGSDFGNGAVIPVNTTTFAALATQAQTTTAAALPSGLVTASSGTASGLTLNGITNAANSTIVGLTGRLPESVSNVQTFTGGTGSHIYGQGGYLTKLALNTPYYPGAYTGLVFSPFACDAWDGSQTGFWFPWTVAITGDAYLAGSNVLVFNASSDQNTPITHQGAGITLTSTSATLALVYSGTNSATFPLPNAVYGNINVIMSWNGVQQSSWAVGTLSLWYSCGGNREVPPVYVGSVTGTCPYVGSSQNFYVSAFVYNGIADYEGILVRTITTSSP